MEGFGGFLSSVDDGIADTCIVPSRREERNGLSVASSPKYQWMKKKKKGKMKAVQQRKQELHKSKKSLSCITDLKTEENFMVEMPLSGLKVSCVLLQVDKKLISLHAHYVCNMHWWRGDDNNNSLLLMLCSPVVSEIWVCTGCCVWVQVIDAANSPGQALW